ncbi:hypothetical protein K458DRAFT_380541 [Lentithecium fluviatile CBS 122367]|uniref:Serine hydrolase domain-containing protein n=1 Tax=Lentithecium fluviatile CBS 122367 TaxID=1168545 RepID=A0A6G1ICQ5_9PLEO|nr:hypothetical protein K458DRAFT_380541 [Lentithecium fluviatile CBS 122367]
MRFLCLHGMGTNERVMKMQIASLCHALGDHHEYDFVEGSIPCSPTPGIAQFLTVGEEAETFCFYEPNSAKSILTALADLAWYIASEGPYQGVIGFSQGAALAATLMIKQGRNHYSTVHPLFQCAIFLCAGAPYDPVALDQGKAVLLEAKPDAPSIRVATAHVVGEKDDALAASLALVEQCDPRNHRVYMHAGGHDVPREVQGVRRMISVVEEVLHLASHAQ